ncbi:MAG: hypothetical protein DRP09_15535 [Candidatus Thorarchaeota archaeon]|nr:MAG: hypothetical protein DRP09_15535 [Candidatus Thorarchaeota archaeon]
MARKRIVQKLTVWWYPCEGSPFEWLGDVLFWKRLSEDNFADRKQVYLFRNKHCAEKFPCACGAGCPLEKCELKLVRYVK